jgi:TPR repeat protein
MNGRAEIPNFRPADKVPSTNGYKLMSKDKDSRGHYKAATYDNSNDLCVNEQLSWHTNSFTTNYDKLLHEAEAGDARSQYNLGFCYERGIIFGVPNDNEAGKWYQRAAIQGNSRAQNKLGIGYGFGAFGFPVNYKEALKWYTRAAKAGDADAQSCLGLWYLNGGNGVYQDHEKAVDWFTRAAKAGDWGSQFNLGLCYRDGLGTDKDEKEAAKWFTKAAEKGDEEAKKQLEILKSK